MSRQLTQTHRDSHTIVAIDFLGWYHREDDALLDNSVTGDECWVYFECWKPKKLRKWEKQQTNQFPKNCTVSGKNHVDFLLGSRGSASHAIFANKKGKGAEEAS